MTFSRFFKLYLPPSVLSLLTGVLVVGGYSGLILYSMALKSGSLYDFVLGENNTLRSVDSFKGQMSVISAHVSQSRTADRLPTFIIWMLIGLVVYAMIEGVRGAIVELHQTKQQSTYVNAVKDNVYKRALTKFGIRMGIAAVMAVFIGLMLSFGMPYCIRLLQVAAYALSKPLSLIYIGIALAIMGIAFHLLVILMRLYVLRPRVFSSTAD